MPTTDALSTSMHGIAAHALWALKGGYRTSTLTGTATLDDTYPTVCGIDPGGAARDVRLDSEATAGGLLRLIVNRADAAETITVKSNDGTGTIGSLAQNTAGIFYCDPTDGWTRICTWTIAL